MSGLKTERNDKLERCCATLANVIISLRPLYSKSDSEQKVLIETMVGAAIWYLPKPPNAWTGFISREALKSFHPQSGILKPKLSEEHVYPRKVVAKLLFEDNDLMETRLAILYREKYGRLHYITPGENKSVQQFQRVNVFTTPDDAYTKAGLILIKISAEELRLIKRRDRITIEKHLNWS